MALNKSAFQKDIGASAASAAEEAFKEGLKLPYGGDPETHIQLQAKKFGEAFAASFGPNLAEHIDKYIQALITTMDLGGINYDALRTPLVVGPNQSIENRFQQEYGVGDFRGDLLEYLEKATPPLGIGGV